MKDIKDNSPYDCVVIAVKHSLFIESFNLEFYRGVMNKPLVLIDIKGLYDRKDAESKGFIYWRL